MNRRQFLEGVASAAILSGCALQRSAATAGGTLRIAHCGDPQFGMGLPRTADRKQTPEGYRADLMRLEREIEILNGMDLDLVYFTGDMTHVAEDVTKDWPRLLKKIRHRVAVSPGNHDMGNRLTATNADRFVSVFGREYESFRLKDWRIIVGNSQYWRPTDEERRRTLYELWMEEQLESAKADGEKVILATHIPPFVSLVYEADSYENFPFVGRFAFLERLVDCGVRFYLSGHTHTMLHRAWKSMEMLNAETTCNNFDGRPFGFRLLEILPDGRFDWTFHPIAPIS